MGQFPTWGSFVSIVLNLLLHTLLIGSLGLFLVAIVRVTLATEDNIERAIRAIALLAGAMVALGAQASGSSFATFTVNSLSGSRPVGTGVELLAAIIPGGVGVGMGWYIIRSLNRNETIAVRVLAFVGMLAAVSFAEVYAVATKTQGVILGAAAIPNSAFILGVMLYIVLKYQSSNTKTSRRGRLGALAGGLAKNRQDKQSGN